MKMADVLHSIADNAQFFTANTTYTKKNNLQILVCV